MLRLDGARQGRGRGPSTSRLIQTESGSHSRLRAVLTLGWLRRFSSSPSLKQTFQSRTVGTSSRCVRSVSEAGSAVGEKGGYLGVILMYVTWLNILHHTPAAMGREGAPHPRTVRSVRASIVRAERGERQKRSRVPDPTSPETDLNPPCWRRDQFRDLSDIFQTREVVGQFLKLTSTELRALLACSTTGVPRRAGLHHPRAAARRRALVHGRLT